MSDEQTPLDQNCDLRSREHDRLYSILEKTEEATIKSAENAIRILLLINGGAAVAVLAFVGNLASKGSVQTDQLNAMAGSLVWFAFGVAGAVVCAFFFYLTNISYLFARRQKDRMRRRLRLARGNEIYAGARTPFEFSVRFRD